MTDWKSLGELTKDSAIFTKFMHALLGLFAWEWFISLDFDWDVISGKKRFRWPLIFYFADRYLLLFALIGIAIALDTTTEIDCRSLYTFNQLAGDAAVGLASINLSIRTMAVWSQNRYIIALLVLIIMGHWSLILQGVLVHAVWVDGQGCVIASTGNTVLAATFIYSMCFDLIVLCLNAWKLVDRHGQGVGRGSRLAKLIFSDGLIFFVIAFLANLLATVFMLLNLNQIMSVIFNVPAAVASTIVSCRAVRRLTNFTNQGPEVFAASNSHSGPLQFRSTVSGGRVPGVSTKHGVKAGGVHVQMETFTHAAAATETDIDYQKYDLGREPALNASSPTRSDSDVDLESKGAFGVGM